MQKLNVCKVVTAFMVIGLTAGVYFILPEVWFPTVVDGIVRAKIIVSAFFASALSTLIININPKNFFNLRESSEVIVAILIALIFLCAII